MKGYFMKLSIKQHLLGLLAVPALVLSVSSAPVFAANNISLSQGAGSARGDDQASCLFGTEAGCTGQTPLFKTITNVLLFIIGAVSVIMLIIGGIRYTVSQGDSTAIQNAKNTILYAIIGIVVAILAFALVNFVISNFASANNSTTP
jgi:hypothetical protein